MQGTCCRRYTGHGCCFGGNRSSRSRSRTFEWRISSDSSTHTDTHTHKSCRPSRRTNSRNTHTHTHRSPPLNLDTIAEKISSHPEIIEEIFRKMMSIFKINYNFFSNESQWVKNLKANCIQLSFNFVFHERRFINSKQALWRINPRHLVVNPQTFLRWVCRHTKHC